MADSGNREKRKVQRLEYLEDEKNFFGCIKKK